ncbi:MAG: hypothetical protein WCJ33_09180 [Pseudomonadota bacterium]
MSEKRPSHDSQHVDTLPTIDRAISEFILRENKYLCENNIEEHVTEETQMVSNIFTEKNEAQVFFLWFISDYDNRGMAGELFKIHGVRISGRFTCVTFVFSICSIVFLKTSKKEIIY